MVNGVILISGQGSNLKSIIDNADSINLNISCVISNNASANGINYAKQATIPYYIIEHNKFSSKEEFETQLIKVIDKYDTKVIILAGFMYILTAKFINKYWGKILNIHPSLLPKFKGVNTHHRVIKAGHEKHGVSVHFVTAELDSGAIIAQKSVDVLATDNAKSITKKVLVEEHKLYPKVINLFTQGRLKLQNNKVFIDGEMQLFGE